MCVCVATARSPSQMTINVDLRWFVLCCWKTMEFPVTRYTLSTLPNVWRHLDVLHENINWNLACVFVIENFVKSLFSNLAMWVLPGIDKKYAHTSYANKYKGIEFPIWVVRLLTNISISTLRYESSYTYFYVIVCNFLFHAASWYYSRRTSIGKFGCMHGLVSI